MGIFGNQQKPEISRVKCLGVRTAEETKVLGTYNSTIYCFLVEYTDRSREICECEANSKQIAKLINYIEM